jgi:hypothetical protein
MTRMPSSTKTCSVQIFEFGLSKGRSQRRSRLANAQDPHHAITERRGVPTAIWEIIFFCGYPRNDRANTTSKIYTFY